MAHAPELRDRAKELRKQGLLIRVIAEEIGVPKATVTRWLNPTFEKRERGRARRRKYSKKYKCPACGRRMSDRSKLCLSCSHARQRRWTRERIIEAIRAWAVKHGFPPTSDDWQRGTPDHPAVSSIRGGPNPPFRTWSEALSAAGFEPWKRRARPGKRPMTPAQKEERAVLRRRIREENVRKALKKENSNDHARGV